jgi:hypothetical protein
VRDLDWENLHPFGDPRVEPAEGPGALLHAAKMPAQAKAVLVAKCADCHSGETRWRVGPEHLHVFETGCSS